MFPSLFKYNLKRSNHRLTDTAPTYCQQKFFSFRKKYFAIRKYRLTFAELMWRDLPACNHVKKC